MSMNRLVPLAFNHPVVHQSLFISHHHNMTCVFLGRGIEEYKYQMTYHESIKMMTRVFYELPDVLIEDGVAHLLCETSKTKFLLDKYYMSSPTYQKMLKRIAFWKEKNL